MAIKTWVAEGKTFFQIDVCARSRANRDLRVQRRESGVLEGVTADTDPEVIRKKLNRIEVRLAYEARREIAEREGAGITWGDLVERWADALEQESQLPNDGLRTPLKWSTARGHIQAVEDFTEAWMRWRRPRSLPLTLKTCSRGFSRSGTRTAACTT